MRTEAIFFASIIPLIPVLLGLWMPKRTDEVAVLTVSMVAFSTSFGAFLVPNDTLGLQGRYLVGSYLAWFGLFFKEVSILQRMEDRRRKLKKHRISPVRFARLLGLRAFQIFPMIVWGAVLSNSFVPLFLLSLLLMLLMIVSAFIESAWL